MLQETILVLEDDPAVMGVVRATLETDYRVYGAESASQALEIFYRIPAEIHLVLADQTLREGTGQEVVKQLKGMRPDMQVLYFSGYDRERLLESGVPADAEILQKPFKPSQLRARVAGLLQRGRTIVC
jgi:two-component system cell cycle sensor histidine kinase/response regulator CckA